MSLANLTAFERFLARTTVVLFVGLGLLLAGATALIGA